MKRWFLVLLAPILISATPLVASADVSGLTPCKDSAVFKRRLDASVKKLTSRLENYDEGSPAYLALEVQIDKTKARFDK
jgi:photosystem I subunit 3